MRFPEEWLILGIAFDAMKRITQHRKGLHRQFSQHGNFPCKATAQHLILGHGFPHSLE